MSHFKTAIATVTAIFSISAYAQETAIEVKKLPAEAKSFLENHFKGKTIVSATRDKEVAKTTFEVKLSDGSELEFTEEGAWKEVDGNHQPIPTGFITAAITEYAAKNYPNEKITKIDKSWRKIEIELTNKIELQFDTAGKFIKVDN